MDTFRFAYQFCRPHRWAYLAGLCLVPLSIGSTLSVPYLTGEATELLETGQWETGALAPILLAIVGMALLRSCSLFGMRFLMITASRKLEFDLRNHIFSHLQSQDQIFFKSARTGDLLTRLTSDVERARIIAGPVVMYAASTCCMLVIAIPLMVSLSWLLTVTLMLPLCLLTLAVRQIGPRVHERVFRAQEALSDLSSDAQENFAGVRVVKSFAQEDDEIKSFATIGKRYLEENLRAARLGAWMQPIVGGVNDLAVLSILLLGGYYIVSGDMKFSDFIKFSGYQMQLIWPMISIGWVINQYQRGSASIRRLQELLTTKPRVEDGDVRPSTRPLEGGVSIRNLTFAYGDKTVLHDVSLEVPRGATVAIVGRTGAGKSTLVSLIPRVYPTPKATVFMDGIDIHEYPLEQLRKSIGFVPQESFLFSRTLMENIAFGVDSWEEADIHGVASLTRLETDIDQFPNGYHEIVGERGVTLSGGQKQRAALARALLIRPRILILDDALSAVDTNTEEEILQNLLAFTRDLTTIVVSHRISSIKHAERIYVLDEGRIAEEGTHEELLKVGKLYAEMYRIQLISDELERM